MISNRNKRSSDPQERPKQFAINSSAGMDFNKPSTDFSSVQYLENLSVNLDGSVSLRKRLRPVSRAILNSEFNSLIPVFELYESHYALYEYQGATGKHYRICDKLGNSIPMYLAVRHYFTPDRLIKIPVGTLPCLDFSNSSEIHTSSTTIVGNVLVDMGAFRTMMANSSEPPSDVSSEDIVPDTLTEFVKSPKYVKISLELEEYFPDGEEEPDTRPVAIVEVMISEPNVMRNEEGKLNLDPDMNLDYPWSTRDIYGGVGGTLLNVVAYYVEDAKVFDRLVDTVVDKDLNPLYHNYIETADLLVRQDYTSILSNMRMFELTENPNVNVLNTFAPDTFRTSTVFKAFCKIPRVESKIYLGWEYNRAGVWYPVPAHRFNTTGNVRVNLLAVLNEDAWDGDENNVTGNENSKFRIIHAIELFGEDAKDPIAIRPDVLPADAINYSSSLSFTKGPRIAAVRCCLLSKGSEVIKDGNTEVEYTRATVLDTRTFEIEYTSENRFDDSFEHLPNAAAGSKLYYRKSIYSYGKDWPAIAYRSHAGEVVAPFSNIIDVQVSSTGGINSIVPWRDHLIMCTPNTIILATRSGDGFLTKTVSTDVGVPELDANSVQSTLNGIVFKSGRKIYMAYPNLYAGDDTQLMLTEISRPIEHVLNDIDVRVDDIMYSMFESDSYTLILSLNSTSKTVCLKFDMSRRTWEVCVFPIRFIRFIRKVSGAVTAVDAYGVEYSLFEDPRTPSLSSDILGEASSAYVDIVYDGTAFVSRPISFELDTGDKATDLTTVKQFVESKLMFATDDDAEAFPMRVTVVVDGDPHVSTVDVNTDAPFWKTQDSDGNYSKGVAGSLFRLTTGEVGDSPFGRQSSGILRQLSLRYSGKGRAIRHIVSGEAASNFKLYETYIKYKPIRY